MVELVDGGWWPTFVQRSPISPSIEPGHPSSHSDHWPPRQWYKYKTCLQSSVDDAIGKFCLENKWKSVSQYDEYIYWQSEDRSCHYYHKEQTNVQGKGKPELRHSRLLDPQGALCYDALLCMNPTAAAIFWDFHLSHAKGPVPLNDYIIISATQSNLKQLT